MTALADINALIETAVGGVPATQVMQGERSFDLVGRDGQERRAGPEGRAGIIFLATAHPAKFAEIVDPNVGRDTEKPRPLAQALARPRHIIRIEPSLDAVRAILTND